MKKLSLIMTLVMLVSLFGVASPAPVAADPIPGTVVQIPVIQVGAGWETWIQVQNVGQGDTKFALLLFGYSGPYCGPQCLGPRKVEFSGRVPVGGAWTYKLATTNTFTCAGAAFTPTSGLLISLSMAQAVILESVTCANALINLNCLWMNTFAGVVCTSLPANWGTVPTIPAGAPAAVSVNRILTTGGTPQSAAYTGIFGAMEGIRDPRTGAYMYYAPMLFDTFSPSGWSSTIYIQNSGFECTSLEIWFQRQQDCLKNRILEVLALCPGETVKIDLRDEQWGITPGFMGSAWIRASQPLGVIVDEYNSNGSILMSSRGMPTAIWDQTLNGGLGGWAFDPGSLFNFAPLIYREYNGWNTGIRVQNLSSTLNALVKVYFLDNSGDIIDTIVEWICPRGSQTFYLAQINTLPGQYVGQARIESQNWWGPGDPPVAAPTVLSVVNLVNYVSGQGAAYNAFPKQEVLQTVFGKWVGLPFLARDKHDPYEPTGTHWTSEIAMTNLDMIPGVSVYRIDFFDQNGLLYSLCQTLNEKQVDYINLDHIGIIPSGWLGSAIISWQCSSTSPVDVGALGVVVVELAHGYPSGDLTKVYEGFPLATAPNIPAAVACPECLQLCPSGSITGIVTNAGAALAVATVELWSAGGNNTWDGGPVQAAGGDDYLYATTISGAAGAFTFVNVAARAAPGQGYAIRASLLPAYAWAWIPGLAVGAALPVSVACAAIPVVPVVSPDVPVLLLNIWGTAHISPFATGLPLSGAVVQLWTATALAGPYTLSIATTTNTEGNFTFLARPPAAFYELHLLFLCQGNPVSAVSPHYVGPGAAIRRVEINPTLCVGNWVEPF